MLGKGLESLIAPIGDDASKRADALPPDKAIQKEPEVHMAPGTRAVRPEHPPQKERGEERPSRLRDEEIAVFHIEVEKISPNPNQPRKEFNEVALRELADSIREVGILQPLVVTKVEREVPSGTDVQYELIAGERRLMAAKIAGLPRVPVIVRKGATGTEQLQMAIIENLQREDLNPLEAARAFSRLQDEFRLTQREIASRLGKSREAIANTLRLLDLPTVIQQALQEGRITESHGRLLLSIPDLAAQEKLFLDIMRDNLTTREAKNRVSRVHEEEKKKDEASPELLAIEERLASTLGAPVKISGHGEEKGGKITITFYSKEELAEILKHLGAEEEEF